jgi:hypothetical protein
MLDLAGTGWILEAYLQRGERADRTLSAHQFSLVARSVGSVSSQLTYERYSGEGEALSHPLSRGDEVWVGARRGHVLAPSGIDIPVAGTGIVHDFAHALAERLRGSVRYPDEAAGTDPARGDVALQADPLSFGFIAVDLERALRLGSLEALEAGHLLIVPGRS